MCGNRWQPCTSRGCITRPADSCPDGRVYVGGGGKKDGFTDQRTAELFSPPYLFKGSRPVITGVVSQLGNNQVKYNEAFTVATATTNVTRATLVRLPSTTHSLDFNQRFNELPATSRGGGRISDHCTSERESVSAGALLSALTE